MDSALYHRIMEEVVQACEVPFADTFGLDKSVLYKILEVRVPT
jgi:hypothetical protein